MLSCIKSLFFKNTAYSSALQTSKKKAMNAAITIRHTREFGDNIYRPTDKKYLLNEKQAQYPDSCSGNRTFNQCSQGLQFVPLVEIKAGKLGYDPKV